MSREPASYVCPSCGARSYHPRDREEKYCGRCHLFEDDDPMHLLGAPADRRRLSASSPPAAPCSEEFDCIECGRWSVFDETLKLRRPTAAEWDDMSRDADVTATTLAWALTRRRSLRRLRPHRAGSRSTGA